MLSWPGLILGSSILSFLNFLAQANNSLNRTDRATEEEETCTDKGINTGRNCESDWEMGHPLFWQCKLFIRHDRQLFTAASQRIPEFHMLGCSCKKIEALDAVMHFHAVLRKNCMFYSAFSFRSILFWCLDLPSFHQRIAEPPAVERKYKGFEF